MKLTCTWINEESLDELNDNVHPRPLYGLTRKTLAISRYEDYIAERLLEKYNAGYRGGRLV